MKLKERKTKKIIARATQSTVRFDDDREKDSFSIRFDSKLERMKEREARHNNSRSNYSVLKGSEDRRFKSMKERQKWFREEAAKEEFKFKHLEDEYDRKDDDEDVSRLNIKRLEILKGRRDRERRLLNEERRVERKVERRDERKGVDGMFHRFHGDSEIEKRRKAKVERLSAKQPIVHDRIRSKAEPRDQPQPDIDRPIAPTPAYIPPEHRLIPPMAKPKLPERELARRRPTQTKI